MKISWVMAVVSAVVCTAASMVLFGQHALWTKLSGDEAQQGVKQQLFEATLSERQFVKHTLQNQLEQQRKTVREMEVERDKAALDESQKSADLNSCEGDKKKKDEELAGQQKAQADAEVNLSKESGAWKEEIASLKQMKEQPSKICAYIKKNSAGAKLCTTPDPAAKATDPAAKAADPAAKAADPAAKAADPAAKAADPAAKAADPAAKAADPAAKAADPAAKAAVPAAKAADPAAKAADPAAKAAA